jgi:hypothetical protein
MFEAPNLEKWKESKEKESKQYGTVAMVTRPRLNRKAVVSLRPIFSRAVCGQPGFL